MQEAPAKQVEKKDVKNMDQAPVRNAPMKMRHECYMMKHGALMHCMGDKAEPQKTEVKLRNGSMISPDGIMKSEDGQSTKLQNGQCVLLNGVLGDCEKMHSKMDTPMQDKKSHDQK